MGVLACSKITCDQVMCDRYAYDFGYLCDHCFEELLLRSEAKGSTLSNEEIYLFLDEKDSSESPQDLSSILREDLEEKFPIA